MRSRYSGRAGLLRAFRAGRCYKPGQVVAELLKPLADKKAPERARLAALTAMAQVAQKSEGAMIFGNCISYSTPHTQLAPDTGTSRTWAGSFVEKATWVGVSRRLPRDFARSSQF